VPSLRRRIVGPPGSKVTLGFDRAGHHIEALLTRGTPDYLAQALSSGAVVHAPGIVPPADDDANTLRVRLWQLEAERESDRQQIQRLKDQGDPRQVEHVALVKEQLRLAEQARDAAEREAEECRLARRAAEAAAKELSTRLAPSPSSLPSDIRPDRAYMHDGRGTVVDVAPGSIHPRDLAQLFPTHNVEEIFDTDALRFAPPGQQGFQLRGGGVYFIRPNPLAAQFDPSGWFAGHRPMWNRVVHEVFVFDHAEDAQAAAETAVSLLSVTHSL